MSQGTGLGLFMCKTIIERVMHGSLTVRNTANGAEFTLTI
ncbi:MAG: ATP-binding protein [Geobacter sp.]